MSSLPEGVTVECDECGTAVLVLAGVVDDLTCHGRRMRIRPRGVSCCESQVGTVSSGLRAGATYRDRGSLAVVRCTRGGGGWPTASGAPLEAVEPALSTNGAARDA